MKILFIGSGKKPSTFIQKRLDALIGKGVTCLLPIEFSFTRQINYFFSIFKLFMVKPNRVYYFLKIIVLQKEEKRFRVKIKKALKYVDFLSIKPDVIHFQWIDHVSSFNWLISYFKVPVVASVRGSMVTVYPYNNPDYTKKLKQSFKKTDYIHYVSNSLKDICIKEFGVSSNKTVINYNGIDIKKFRPKEEITNKNQEYFTIISVGSLMWRKGIFLQLMILNLLKDIPVRLLLIGSGEDEFKLQYQVKKLHLEKKVSFLGTKSENEIINYLNQADLYISTSIAEGLSNSVLEAVSCGLPVVAFECEGMNEVIINEETGFVVPFGGVQLMVNKIKELHDNREKLQIMGRNARLHAVKNFEMSTHVENMIQFYKQIIK